MGGRVGIGYLLYLCRRIGGGMVLPIVVHRSWDFSTFSSELGLDDAPVLGDQRFLMFLSSIVLVVVVVIRHRAIPSTPSDPPPAPAVPAA